MPFLKLSYASSRRGAINAIGVSRWSRLDAPKPDVHALASNVTTKQKAIAHLLLQFDPLWRIGTFDHRIARMLTTFPHALVNVIIEYTYAHRGHDPKFSILRVDTDPHTV